MLSASAFSSADNTYLDLDYSGYHKNLIQLLFIILSLLPSPGFTYDELSDRLARRMAKASF